MLFQLCLYWQWLQANLQETQYTDVFFHCFILPHRVHLTSHLFRRNLWHFSQIRLPFSMITLLYSSWSPKALFWYIFLSYAWKIFCSISSQRKQVKPLCKIFTRNSIYQWYVTWITYVWYCFNINCSIPEIFFNCWIEIISVLYKLWRIFS